MKPLYLECDASGIGLDAWLLQVRDGMSFPRYEASNNVVLWPIAFANKSLSSVETDIAT